jgi:hypothetical protein
MQEIELLQSLEKLKGKYLDSINILSPEDKLKLKPVFDEAIEESKYGKGNMLHLMILIKEL